MKSQQQQPPHAAHKKDRSLGSTTGSLARKIQQIGANAEAENTKEYISPIKVLQKEVVSSTERLKSDIRSCNILSLPILAKYDDISHRLKAELDQDKQSVQELEHIIAKVDALSEELKVKRRQIMDLENDKAQLLGVKDQLLATNRERDFLARDNEKLKGEIKMIKEELGEIKRKKQSETDKYKKSFDEMDALIEKEREAHRMEEENLKQLNQQLQNQLKHMSSVLEDFQREKLESERFCAELQESEKESKLQLAEAADRAKQKDHEYEADCKDIKSEALLLQNKCLELESTNEKLRGEIFKLAQYQSLFNIEKDKVAFLVISTS